MPTFTARSTPEPSPTVTRPNSPISNLRRPPNYYLPGGDLYIQVDDTLFCIHSYFFIRESSRWLNFLRNTTQGRTTHNPIVLSLEFNLVSPPTPHTFAQFLWVFYNPYYGIYDVSIATWWNIEVYAAYFEMAHILDLVNRELHQLIQYHRRQQSTTPWQTLSLHDGSDPPTVDDADSWNLSETPYDEWVTNT